MYVCISEHLHVCLLVWAYVGLEWVVGITLDGFPTLFIEAGSLNQT